MLSARFLARLADAFPEFYEEVDRRAAADATELLAQVDGDLDAALLRARLRGARAVWWPYVKGSAPLVRADRDAMKAFTHQVLLVHHLVGHRPATMAEARDQVVRVLTQAVDHERLREALANMGLRADGTKVAHEATDPDGKVAVQAAGAGIAVSAASVVGPLLRSKWFRRSLKRVPLAIRLAAGAVILSALASLPLVAGFTAGARAEDAARRHKAIDDQVKPAEE